MEKPLRELMEIFKKHGLTMKDASGLFNRFNNMEGLRMLRDQLMEQLSEDDVEHLLQMLKKVGFLVEKKANTAIQQGLNRKEIFQKVYKSAKEVAPLMRDLSEWVEAVSIPLNLPTKNDVANVAKLTLQNEEKLESIEDQLKSLENSFAEWQGAEKAERPVASLPSEDISLREYKKLLILQSILQTSNLFKKD